MSDQGAKRAQPILVNQIVAYMDFLGFRSAIAAPTGQAQADILATLREFKAAEQDFKIEVKKDEDDQHTTIVKPGISSFSDHMVVSFNLADMHGNAVGYYQAFMSVRNIANAIAHRGREFGCLVRGAVTIGPLFHEQGIIFGQGLVDAHRLESTVAINPRIIIDDSALEGVIAGTDSNITMFRDDDGRWCLDYMTAYLEYLDRQTRFDRSETGCTVRRKWALGTRGNAIDMAAKLESVGNAKAAGYWRWFARRFEKSMRDVNPAYFSVDGSPIPFPD